MRYQWTNTHLNSAWVWMKIEFLLIFLLLFDLNFICALKPREKNSNKFTTNSRIDFIGTAWDDFIGIYKENTRWRNIETAVDCLDWGYSLLKSQQWECISLVRIFVAIWWFNWFSLKTSSSSKTNKMKFK